MRRPVACIAVALLSLAVMPCVSAVEELVILPPQTVKSLTGVVAVNGDPIVGANVIEYSADWKTELRRTTTDGDGRFALQSVKGRKVYYLHISAPGPGINPARVAVKLSRWRGKKSLEIGLHLA